MVLGVMIQRIVHLSATILVVGLLVLMVVVASIQVALVTVNTHRL